MREHRKVLYCNLLTSGKLYEHLAEIDTSACNMAEYLIKEMARKQGVTEQLKAEDMMRWVGLMNNIRACADEIVLNDIVYKKDPDAIVYMDANEVIIRLTREDFASEKEFLKWKALSDEDYHASEKEAHVYANHTLALDELSEEAASIPAVDVCMEQAHDRAEAIHRSVRKVTQIRKHLTDTQFRRVWMYFVDGMTVDEIGAAEGVSHQNISKSIGSAMKKIKKFFP